MQSDRTHTTGSVSAALIRRGVALTAAAVALALIAVAPAAHAQARSHSLAIGAFGGYNLASDIYNDLNGTNSSLELHNGFEWGGRVTFFNNEYSAFELAYTRNGSDMEINSFGGVIPNGFDAGRLNLDQFDLNWLISRPTSNSKMWPYFTMGVGMTNTHPEVNALNPNTNQPIDADGNSLFAFNLGIGTMIDMSPKIGLRLDARWRVTDTNITTDAGVYCDYWGYCWSYASDWYDSGEFTAGLTYKFGN